MNGKKTTYAYNTDIVDMLHHKGPTLLEDRTNPKVWWAPVNFMLIYLETGQKRSIVQSGFIGRSRTT